MGAVCTRLRPAITRLDFSTLERTFTLPTDEGFVERSPPRSWRQRPLRRARRAPALRAQARQGRAAAAGGQVDLDIGVLGETGSEVRVQALFLDRFVGVARLDPHAPRW